ncbi:GNAT family N-acetyltransferase [Xylanibacter rodentium]|jgi:putative acetyltransferase|uniref:GNAT family N-acetyltransferase n=1 Tax=Xylanibacter rodentium TaxID=2736289 RepID=UPI0020A69D1C|nr:GNAT family N-acetyltransferase [Xylanibacter rodentium]
MIFLDGTVIQAIKTALILDYFPNVDLYALTIDDSIAGFIGLCDDKIEMLFIDDCVRGCGYGSVLIGFSKTKGVSKVDVNEQNPSAFAFYRSKGFRIIGRDETDDSGRPYPILHLAL